MILFSKVQNTFLVVMFAVKDLVVELRQIKRITETAALFLISSQNGNHTHFLNWTFFMYHVIYWMNVQTLLPFPLLK